MVLNSFSKNRDRILCYYFNGTSYLQLAKLQSTDKQPFEQLVFPGQRVLFEAIPDALLEVYRYASQVTLLAEIPCQTLQVNDKS
jgi:hypothetical protein